MEIIKNKLNNDFVILDLGSSFAKQNSFLKKFSSSITYIELDALSNSSIENKSLFKNIKLNKGIHPQKGSHTFYEREYLQCSSFLKFKPEVNEMYGIASFTKTKNEIEIDCITVDDILLQNNLTHIDFLKTDLEGLDFEIIKSLGEKLKSVNVLQSEIRFQPLFEGEKSFFEICEYVHKMGFEFINFALLDEWKLNTSDTKNHRDGRMVWGDFVFFRKLEAGSKNFEIDLLKQVLIAKSLHFNSYAAFLLESNKKNMDATLYKEVAKEINNETFITTTLNKFFYFISYFKITYPIRKAIKYIYKRSQILQQHKHLIP